MTRSQGGFILLTTLLMMVILTIFVLSSLQTLYLHHQMSNQLIANHQAFYELESMAENMVHHLATHENCSSNELNNTHITANFLKQYGCKISNSAGMQDTTFYYSLTDLGNYPCLELIEAGLPYESHHWLLHIMSQHLPSQVLQLRIALAQKKSVCASTDRRRIKSGIISWNLYRV